MTSLPSPAAVAADAAPPLLLLPLSSVLYHIWRRWGGAWRAVRVLTAQSHRIGYHRGDVIGGAELSPWDGHLTVRVVKGDFDVWWHGGASREGGAKDHQSVNQAAVQSKDSRQSGRESSVHGTEGSSSSSWRKTQRPLLFWPVSSSSSCPLLLWPVSSPLLVETVLMTDWRKSLIFNYFALSLLITVFVKLARPPRPKPVLPATTPSLSLSVFILYGAPPLSPTPDTPLLFLSAPPLATEFKEHVAETWTHEHWHSVTAAAGNQEETEIYPFP